MFVDIPLTIQQKYLYCTYIIIMFCHEEKNKE